MNTPVQLRLDHESVRSKGISRTIWGCHKIILSNQMPETSGIRTSYFSSRSCSRLIYLRCSRDLSRCYYKDLPMIHDDDYINVGRTWIMSVLSTASTLLSCLLVGSCIGDKKRIVKRYILDRDY